MKKLSLDEIYFELNEILYKKKLIDEMIDFDDLNTTQIIIIIAESIKIMEHRLFNKGQKNAGIYLRKIYTLLEKLIQHEKKKIQEFKRDDLKDHRVKITTNNYEIIHKYLKDKIIKDKIINDRKKVIELEEVEPIEKIDSENYQVREEPEEIIRVTDDEEYIPDDIDEDSEYYDEEIED